MLDETQFIERASVNDLNDIHQLLQMVNLPIGGVKEHIDNFLILKDKSTAVKGCIGLELYSEYALLRSAAVHPEDQNQGIGKKLTEAIITHAKKIGIKKLFLITNTAEEYFKKKGFAVVQENEIPASVKQSVEFTFQCAKTGKTMMLEIRKMK
ncbi:MAG: arsenic resistance N-acetyltransferase ArsN2 [Candidatus Heimdallarchaeota archaeon]